MGDLVVVVVGYVVIGLSSLVALMVLVLVIEVAVVVAGAVVVVVVVVVVMVVVVIVSVVIVVVVLVMDFVFWCSDPREYIKSIRGLEVASFSARIGVVVVVSRLGALSVVVSSICLNVVFISSSISLLRSGTASKDLNKLILLYLLFSSIISPSDRTLKKSLI